MSKFTIPESVSDETIKWAKKNEKKLIGVVCRGRSEYPIIVCPQCDCPRFADYACDTCARQELEKKCKDLLEKNKEFVAFSKRSFF